jgi:hypothetical protein
MRAGWVKRILFLCDRRELTQAGGPRLQGVHAGRAARHRRRQHRESTATSASTWPPTRR